MTLHRRIGLLLMLLAACVAGAWNYFSTRGARSSGSESAQQAVRAVDGVPLEDWAAVPKSIPPPPSAWLDARSRRYAALFNNWHCDTLLVPLQVEEGGFDRPNRQIMSADLALALAQAGHCVTDPFLTDIALGDSLRRRDDKAVQELARAIRATRIVAVYAGHDHANHMRVTLRVGQIEPGGASARVIAAHSFEGLHFDSAQPPFAAFHALLPKMLAAVNLPQPQSAQVAGGSLPAALPQSLDLFKQQLDESPVAQAAHLVFLAMLGPYEWRATSRLFSKAWLALQQADGKDPQVRLLRARIMFHLWERPYALALLNDIPGPAADGLRAILNSNLPQAREALGRVQDPWEQLFLGLEVHDLELDDGREPRNTANGVRRLVGESPWQYFVELRLGDADQWEVSSTSPILALLEQSFPMPGFSLQDIPLGQTLMELFDHTDAELLTLRRLYELEDQQPQLWCCTSFSPAPRPSDLLDLLDSRIQYTLGHQAYFLYSPQGKYDDALALLQKYDALLADEPCNDELRTWIYDALLKKGERSRHDEFDRGLRQSARITAWWEQAQTRDSNYMLWYMDQTPADPAFPYLRNYTEDYPVRAFWQWHGHEDLVEQRLDFSISNVTPLAELIQRSTGEKRAKYVDMLNSRFIGDADATQLRLDNLPAEKLTPEFLRGEIAADSDNWVLRKALGTMLLARNDFAGVRQVISAYPPFNEAHPNDPVTLSNYASGWGHDLLWVGALNDARPLLQQAADYQTGSAAGSFSAARLALLDGKLADAAAAFEEIGQHYTDFVAYRELACLLFAAQKDREAWALFDDITGRYEDYGFWAAAMVGHRRAGMSDSDLNRWFGEKLAQAANGPDRDNLRSYAFLEQFVDRAPAPSLGDSMKTQAAPSEVVVGQDGKVYLQTLQGTPSLIGPSTFGKERHARLKPGTELPDRYQLAAEAMAALRARRYDEAVAHFDDLASAYKIEHGNLSPLLPYFAFSAAKVGDRASLRQYLEQLPPADQGYEVTLARAVFAALGGQNAAAAELLDQALHSWAGAHGNHFPLSAYQYLSICVLLYEDTRDDAYRQAALKLARPFSRLEPAFAFGHAAVAYLSNDEKERVAALATALYLDPRSDWAGKTPAPLQAAARSWFGHNPNPFTDASQDWSGYGSR